MYKSLYYPTLTYGHESWVLTDRMRSRVQAAVMRYLRRVAGVHRIDKVSNSTNRQKLNIAQLLLKVKRSQLRWFGHVLRMPQNRLVYQVHSAQPTGSRPRGRPRTRCADGIRNLCIRVGVDHTQAGETVSCRGLWRSTIAGVYPNHNRGEGDWDSNF